MELGSNAWGSPPHAKYATPNPWSPHNTASSNALMPNVLGRQKWKVSHDITLSWSFILLGRAIFEREDDPPRVQGYHVRGFCTFGSPSTSSAASYFIFFGPRGARNTSRTSSPLGEFFSRPGWLLSRLTWPPGRPLALAGPLGTP